MDHGGSWGGYRAQLLRFPEQHFSVACLCNLANANPEKRAHQVADIFLTSAMKEPAPAKAHDPEKREKKATVPLGADKLAAYSGKFRCDELVATYLFEVKDGKLMLKSIQNGDGFIRTDQNLTLRPVAPDVFVEDEEGLEFDFRRTATGEVNEFHLDAGTNERLGVYAKIEVNNCDRRHRIRRPWMLRGEAAERSEDQ